MRHKQLILALFAAVITSLLSGCVVASHSVNGKHHTEVLGGLVSVEEGAFEKQPTSGFALNSKDPHPGSALSGNKVSILWGLISYRDQ